MLTTFGDLLKTHRYNRHLTQAHVASQIDVCASYIARLESSERHPSRRVVLNLARALGLDDTERDQLLASALHLPQGDVARLVETSGVTLTPPVIQAIAAALQDPALHYTQRDILEIEIIAYTRFRLQQLKDQERAQARPALEYA